MANDSEFTCDVVEVTRVEKHPGADRLELVYFTLDGENEYPHGLISSKGDFLPGMPAVYISPDSSVPLTGRFEFLKKRLDAPGKDRYRIRSARIRGVYSPGLLMPILDKCKLGQSLAKEWDVKPYDAPPEIEVCHGVKPVKKYRPLPDPHPVYSVDSLKKVRLFEEGQAVVVTEKLHGMNFRFGSVDGKFFYGTHRTAQTDSRGRFRRVWDFLMGRHFNKPLKAPNIYSRTVEKYELEEVCSNLADGYIFYGEIFGRGAQDLTYGLSSLELRIFDVWKVSGQRWLSWDERFALLPRMAAFGMRHVPLLYVGPYSLDLVKRLAEQESSLSGIREGVVVESQTGARKKGKWVSEQYHMRKDA